MRPLEPDQVIELWMERGVWLVVEAESGVTFSNQVGGVGMFHPKVEGVLVPLSYCYDGLDESPHGGPDESLHDALCWAREWKDLDEATTERLEAFVKEFGLALNTEEPSVAEAWVPVLWGERKAWLTWENCD